MSSGQLVAKIDGKVITSDELNQWKKERIRDVVQKLALRDIPDGNVDAMMDNLTEQKLGLSHDEVYQRLEKMIRKCTMMTKAAVVLSGKKRKFCRVTIEVPGVSAEHAMREYEKTQLINSSEHLKVNLRACPDHYYLRATGPKDLEVIETCGNNSVPAQFFIKYGDEDGLVTQRDPDTVCQSAGIAVFSNGKVQGGVRHQFKDTRTGCVAELCVEFPGMMPDTLIFQHKMHLVCEFSYWLQWVLDNHPEVGWKTPA